MRDAKVRFSVSKGIVVRKELSLWQDIIDMLMRVKSDRKKSRQLNKRKSLIKGLVRNIQRYCNSMVTAEIPTYENKSSFITGDLRVAIIHSINGIAKQ